MKLIPAIDLKDGKCVRLSGGLQETSIIYNNNPIEQAIFFEKEGCDRIHIVDLDAAFGNKFNNKEVILKIRKEVSIDIELGGGIKSEKNISFWIENGINFLIIGSMAIKQPDYFKEIAATYPNKLYVSIDDLKGHSMIGGWIEKSGHTSEKVLNVYNNSKVRGFVFTDITRDGMMKGINKNKIINLLNISKKPMIVGGGLSDNKDLVSLSNLKKPLLEGLIVGKSFYLGKINIKESILLLKQNA